MNPPEPSKTDWSDAAKRCSDEIQLHIVAGKAGQWAAIRLRDGGSDGIAYETRADAIEHQLHEQLCCYVKIPMDQMPPEAAAKFLAFHRKIYDAGFRMSSPDDQREPVMPLTDEALFDFLQKPRRA